MSADGYIAAQDGSIDFLSMVERSGEDYGYAGFNATVDTVIMGRKTYDKVMSFGIPFPHADRQTYVLTRLPRQPENNIVFHHSGIRTLVEGLKAKDGKNIFIDGGAEIVHEMLLLDLIDELIISIIPVLLGNGIPLFSPGRPEMKLRLVSSTPYPSGLVQLHYSSDSHQYTHS